MSNRVAVVLFSAFVALTIFAASSEGAPQALPANAMRVVAASSLVGPLPAPAHRLLGARPLHAALYARAKALANARAGVHSSSSTAQAGAPTVTSYANVSPSFNGDYDTGGTPPDTTGAMGPDRYIETVNTQFAIYGRTGSLISSGSLSALTGISTSLFGYALSDPQMMWDAKTQRFYYTAVYYDSLFLSDNGLAVGWSKTATPSSASDFCQFAIQFGGELPDYPKLGDSADFLIYGFNQFGNSGNTYEGSQVLTLNKPAPGSTCPATTSFAAYGSGFLLNGDDTKAATPVPANLVDDSNSTGYVVANPDLTSPSPHSANVASVYSVTPNGVDANGIPVAKVSGPVTVTVPTYSIPSSAAQQGTSYLIDTLDGRFEAAVAAVDPAHGGTLALWTAHAVFGGAGSEERWYELDPAAGTVLQSGVVTDPKLFVWNGAISPDRANNGTTGAFGDSWAMSVSTSSSTAYPAVQFEWQRSGGARSALSPLVQSGGADVDLSCSSTTPCRWGDYSGASPDPGATGSVGKVWLGNQYVLAGGTTSNVSWRTWLFGVTPTGGGAALSLSPGPQTLTAGNASAAITVNVVPTQATDTTVTLSSSSTGGGFSTSSTGPFTATLPVTIPATQSASPAFYYRDTKAGTPTITAGATGISSATQTETVNAGPVAAITVTPSSASVAAGGTQLFSASGVDAWNNPVSTAGASWSTNVPAGSVSPPTGSSTTFRAGTSAGSGTVTAGLNGVSNSATVTVTASSPPPAPSSLVASASGRRRINLTWGSSGSGVTYTVYRGQTSGAEVVYRTGVGGTSFTDTGAASGQTYYYEVTAVGPGGESARSNEASATAR
jgi:hypothetical protein